MCRTLLFVVFQNKCFPYWPSPNEPPTDLGTFVVENIGIEENLSYQLTRLNLTKVEVCARCAGCLRRVCVGVSWMGVCQCGFLRFKLYSLCCFSLHEIASC